MAEFLNKFKNGINETMGGLDKGQKQKIIIVSVLFVAVLISFVIYASRPRWEAMYHSSDPVSAGKIYQQLRDTGERVKVEGSTIYVQEGRANDLQMQLYAEGVLDDDGTIPQNNTGNTLFMTSEDKRQAYIKDKQNSLRRSLRNIEGIQDAFVELFLPEDDSFVLSENRKEGTASIMLTMRSNATLSKKSVSGIQNYVSKSVGISTEKVEIIDNFGNPLTDQNSDIEGGYSSNYEMQETHRLKIEKSIEEFLSKTFGKGNVDALVALKLNNDKEVINDRTVLPVDQDNLKGIVTSMQDIRKNWIDASEGGVPGTDSNSEITQYVETDTGKAEYNEVNQTINYDFSEMRREVIKEVGEIEDLSIAVNINKSILKEDVNEDELMEVVKNLVINATIAFTNNADVSEPYVAFMEFDNSAQIAAGLERERAAAEQRTNNLIQVGTAVAFILVFGIAMFAFIRNRITTVEDRDIGLEGSLAAAMEPGVPIEEIDLEDKNEVKKKIEKFVGQKPDQVATLLKSWLNED